MFLFLRWNDKVHGKTAEAFWIWVEDPESNFMYHSEHFLITRKQVCSVYTTGILRFYFLTLNIYFFRFMRMKLKSL